MDHLVGRGAKRGGNRGCGGGRDTRMPRPLRNSKRRIGSAPSRGWGHRSRLSSEGGAESTSAVRWFISCEALLTAVFDFRTVSFCGIQACRPVYFGSRCGLPLAAITSFCCQDRCAPQLFGLQTPSSPEPVNGLVVQTGRAPPIVPRRHYKSWWRDTWPSGRRVPLRHEPGSPH